MGDHEKIVWGEWRKLYKNLKKQGRLLCILWIDNKKFSLYYTVSYRTKQRRAYDYGEQRRA